MGTIYERGNSNCTIRISAIGEEQWMKVMIDQGEGISPLKKKKYLIDFINVKNPIKRWETD